MSFVKKTWKNRQSQYPLRRILTDTATSTTQTVTVTRAEGTVAEQGDAFNAENMNDLENRIASEFANQQDAIEYLAGFADEAEESAENSEAWAVGKRKGVDVPSTDETYQNNSKYYAGQAKTSETNAASSASAASTSMTAAAGSATIAGQKATAAEQSASAAAASAQTATTKAGEASASATNAWEAARESSYSAAQAKASETNANTSSSSASRSADSALNYSEAAEAWAIGKEGGTDVPSTHEAYHNNAKYYSEQANTAATNAETSATEAEASAVRAEQAAQTTEGVVKWDEQNYYGAKNGLIWKKPRLMPNQSIDISGVNWSVDSENRVFASGTSTSAISFSLFNGTVEELGLPTNKELCFTGIHARGANNTFWLRIRNITKGINSVSKYVQDEGDGIQDGKTISVRKLNQTSWYPLESFKLSDIAESGDVLNISIGIDNGVTVNLMFDPMLTIASVYKANTDYAPYAMTNRELTEKVQGIPTVINDLNSDDTVNALSAFIGKKLNSRHPSVVDSNTNFDFNVGADNLRYGAWVIMGDGAGTRSNAPISGDAGYYYLLRTYCRLYWSQIIQECVVYKGFDIIGVYIRTCAPSAGRYGAWKSFNLTTVT